LGVCAVRFDDAERIPPRRFRRFRPDDADGDDGFREESVVVIHGVFFVVVVRAVGFGRDESEGDGGGVGGG
jgi:hypothetical protein